MSVAFYISAAIAILSTAMVITRTRAVHALLWLILSLFSVGVVFFTLGAPFVAALEVIIYAGAIMVLFVFVIMMLNLGPAAADQERRWLTPRTWIAPAIAAAVLLVEVVYIIASRPGASALTGATAPREVGAALFGPYLLAVELAVLVLLSGLLGAYHLGRRWPAGKEGE